MVEVSLLSDVELFSALGDEAVDEVARDAELVRLQRGDVVFREGDASEALYVVASGRLAMLRVSDDGRESLIALMEPGDLFGDLPLFDGLGRSADARALEFCEIVMVRYAPIRAALEARPALLWNVVSLLTRRLRTTDDALADSMFLDVTGRTAKRLLELAGDEARFTLPVTQEELAAIVGASRERVNKAISLFVRLGWLEIEGRSSYRILDRQALEDRATL